MSERTRTLFPLLLVEIPCGALVCSRRDRVYTTVQKLRIKKTMRGTMEVLDEFDIGIALAIKNAGGNIHVRRGKARRAR
ncbi:hypothetical protein BDW75DRAFT_241053 [Aspergillus navahoensis]